MGRSRWADGGGPAVAGMARRPGAGHGVDVAGGHGYAPLGMGGGGHFLDPVVGLVGDVEVAGSVERHPRRRRQQCRGGGPAVARGPRGPRGRAGDGVDIPGGHGGPPLGMGGGGQLLDPVVRGVGDVEVAGGIGDNVVYVPEQGRGGGAAVAGVAMGTVGRAGQGVDVTGDQAGGGVALGRDHGGPLAQGVIGIGGLVGQGAGGRSEVAVGVVGIAGGVAVRVGDRVYVTYVARVARGGAARAVRVGGGGGAAPGEGGGGGQQVAVSVVGVRRLGPRARPGRGSGS